VLPSVFARLPDDGVGKAKPMNFSSARFILFGLSSFSVISGRAIDAFWPGRIPSLCLGKLILKVLLKSSFGDGIVNEFFGFASLIGT